MTAAAQGRSFLSLAAVLTLAAAVLGVAPAEASRYLPSPLTAALEPPAPSVEELASARDHAEALALLGLDDERCQGCACCVSVRGQTMSTKLKLLILGPKRASREVLGCLHVSY